MNDKYPFVNVPLPYAYNALEPYVSEKTLRLHHDALLAGYIERLNALLDKNPQLQGLSLVELVNLGRTATLLPYATALSLRRNAGGVFNHRLYFDSMSPGAKPPRGELEAKINRGFGSFDSFRAKFTAAAMSVFGSGYAWLVETPHGESSRQGELRIVTSANQDTPSGRALLCVDVWEHSYYLDYFNLRDKYLDGWWNIVCFSNAAARLM